MSAVPVIKGRVNVVTLNLGFDVTGSTITSEIREQPNQASTLISTWDVAVVDAESGELTLTLDDSPQTITASEGWMDLKRASGGEAYPIFDRPLRVEFIGSVTV